MEEAVLRDAPRSRDILVRIYRPLGKGPFPVVIFSHGAGGSRDGYAAIGSALAQGGFESIHLQHAGSDRAILHPGRPLKNLAAIRRAALDPKQWVSRALDVKLVLDDLPQLAPDGDTGRVAIAGHSMGAATAMVAAGAKARVPKGTPSLAEPRARAFVAISPQGEGPEFSKDAWKGITRPILLVTGSEDRGLGGEPPSWRTAVFDRLPRGSRYLAYIDGATHTSFAERGDPARWAAAAMVRFLRAEFDGDADSKHWLATDGLSAESGGHAKLRSR